MSRYDSKFNSICELFCHLAKELENGENEDLALIIDYMMYVWLERTLIK